MTTIEQFRQMSNAIIVLKIKTGMYTDDEMKMAIQVLQEREYDVSQWLSDDLIEHAKKAYQHILEENDPEKAEMLKDLVAGRELKEMPESELEEIIWIKNLEKLVFKEDKDKWKRGPKAKKVIRLFEAGKRPHEIEKMGVASRRLINTIRKKLKKEGFVFEKTIRQKAVELLKAGKTVKEVSETLPITISHIRCIKTYIKQGKA